MNGGFSDASPRGSDLIYAYGDTTGRGDFGLAQYSVSTNRWTSLAAPVFSSYYGSLYENLLWVGTRLYIFRTDALSVYDITTNTWGSHISLPSGVRAQQYGMGARDDAGNLYSMTSAGQVLRFNTSTSAFTTLPTTMIPATATSDRLAYDPTTSLLYIVAQAPGSGTQGFYTYDPSAMTTRALTSPPRQITGAFCGDRAGHIYAYSVLTALKYDIATDTWTTLPFESAPIDFNMCTVTASGTLIVSDSQNGSPDYYSIALP